MLRIIEGIKNKKDRVVKMCDMKALQVGMVVEGNFKGHVVMRSQALSDSEIINLTDGAPGGGWSIGETPKTKVRLLNPGEKITIELFNEE